MFFSIWFSRNTTRRGSYESEKETVKSFIDLNHSNNKWLQTNELSKWMAAYAFHIRIHSRDCFTWKKGRYKIIPTENDIMLLRTLPLMFIQANKEILFHQTKSHSPYTGKLRLLLFCKHGNPIFLPQHSYASFEWTANTFHSKIVCQIAILSQINSFPFIRSRYRWVEMFQIPKCTMSTLKIIYLLLTHIYDSEKNYIYIYIWINVVCCSFSCLTFNH